MGFLNGLSLMGSNMAAFAGTAGLEQQKSDLAAKNMALADQLATTRESAGRQEAGQIAATAAGKAQEFEAGQTTVKEAGATQRSAATNTTSLGVAGIGATSAANVAGIQSASAANVAGIGATSAANVAGIGATSAGNVAGIQAASQKYASDIQQGSVYAQIDAAKPEQAALIMSQNQETALKAVQTANASQLQDANNNLASEQAKPQPDPDKVAAAKAQILALGYSSTAEQARAQAQAAIYRTDMDAVQHYNSQLVPATKALNDMAMEDQGRVAQKALVDNLQTQLNGAQKALQFSSDLAHPPTAPAPPVPVGVPPGARYSPSMKIWQDQTGKFYDVNGNPTQKPGTNAPGLINNPGFGGPR